MKKIFVGIITLIITNAAFATSLPGWARTSSKNVAYDTLVEWMQEGPFYKITNVEVLDVKNDVGEELVNVIIHFDDSIGCKERVLDAQCFPADDELACFLVLTDCDLPPKFLHFFNESHRS